MNIAILVTARMGSTRLPGKHMRPLARWTALETLCRRIRHAFGQELDQGRMSLCIATGQEPENRRFEELAPLGARVHYGAPRNIPLRHLQAVRALNAGAVLAVDGDDILCSVEAMRQVALALEAGREYVATRGLPLGMNAFGYGAAFLERSLAGRGDAVLETGWGRIFDAELLHAIDMEPLAPEDEPLRFTLDYPEDLAFFQAVAQALGEDLESAEDAEVLRAVRAGGFAALNAHLNEEYMRNFTQTRDAEAALDRAQGAQG